MRRAWLQYEKKDAAVYISHLDFVRAMNRTLRRGGVPVAYSQGFNPHPLLSFVLPLSVGVTSECELLVLDLAHDITAAELVEAANRAAAPGIRVLAAGEVTDNKMFKNVRYAVYRVTPERMPPPGQIKAFLAQKAIVVDKRTKSGVKPTDIRPDILSISDDFSMVLSAGSVANLKPQTVIEAMAEWAPGFCRFHRTAILDEAFTQLPGGAPYGH